MKALKNCPILIGIVGITIALTIISYAFKDKAYAQYADEVNPADTPHFVLVFKGATEGVFPWSKKADNAEDDTVVSADSTDTQKIVSTEETSTEETLLADNREDGKEDGDSISDNDISGNSISENDADKTYEFTTVDVDYFADALFIGDSRTVGLSEYCKPLDEKATFYAKVSLTIYGVMDKEFVKKGDSKISVTQALSENQFGKIYIMLGLNEMGTGTVETFTAKYTEVIEKIRELQPDALIFIQGIMHVSENKSKKDKYFTNENINERNEALSQLADNKTIFYIDMNEAVDDENGNLIKELSFDDVHLKASSYERWYNYLLEHGIVKD